MIEFPRDPQNSIPTSLVKIIGLGGAGANMLDRVALDGLEGAEMLALNTDIRTLSGSVAGERIQLGRNLTKGLGTGGDPDLGHKAVQEAEDEIRAALKGRKIVFICVGLGGGTGSGSSPIVARIAREEGAFVVMFATMPFVFEGRRRREQAETSLNELAVLSNALVTFDNGRMGELVLAKQGIHEAFAAADRMISESIKAVIRLVVRPGLINVGLDDLMTALRTTRSRCLFGSGIARGKDRAQKALRNALDSPLLDKGSLLEDAQSVLVHLCGGEDLTLFEIELLMESLSKHVPAKAHVLFGAAVDPTMEDQLSITLVSSLPEERLRSTMPEKKIEKKAEPKIEVEPEPSALEPSLGYEASPEPELVIEPEPEPEEEPELIIESEPEPEVEAVEPEPEEEVVASEPEEKPVAKKAKKDSHVPKKRKTITTKLEEFNPDIEIEPLAEDPKPEVEEDESAFFAEPDDEPDDEPEDEIEAEPDPDDAPFAEATVRVEVKSREKRKPKKSEDSELFEAPSEGKKGKSQSELSFDGAPKGRFEGADPSMVDGEDLDVPAFLRKKRQ